MLGAIQSDATLKRVKEAAPPRPGGARLDAVEGVDAKRHPAHSRSRGEATRRPTARSGSGRSPSSSRPIRPPTRSPEPKSSIRERGAITAALYTTSEAVAEAAEEAFARANVALSINLVGNIFVNQSSAFSDYHVTGGNPAGNATLTDAAFVANRFRIAPVRRMSA